MQSIEAQKPLIKCLTFFGFFTFKFDATWSSDWMLKLYCLIVNILLAIMFVISSIFYVETSNEHLGDGNKVTFMCHILEALASHFNACIIVYCILWTQSGQIEFLKNLKSLEGDLKLLPFYGDVIGGFCKWLKINTMTTIAGSLVFFSGLLSCFILILMKDESISHNFQASSYIFSTVYYIFLVTFILHQVMTIQIFFDLINKNLKVFIKRSDFYQKEICFALELHQKLSALIPTFNSSFGVIMLGAFVYLSGIAAIESYFIYLTILMNLAEKSYKFAFYCVANIAWLVPMFIVVQRLGSTCSKVQETVADTVKILKFSNIKQQPEGMLDKCLMSSFHADYKFTANGFFIIDQSMVYNVIKT